MTTIQINKKPVPVQIRNSQSKGQVMRIFENGVDQPPTDIVFIGDKHVGKSVSCEQILNQEYLQYQYYHLN